MKKIVTSLALSASLFAGENSVVATTTPINVVDTKPQTVDMSSHSVSLKVGTLGVGMDIEHMFSKSFALRLNINGLKITRNETIDDIDYDLEAKLLTAGILADYHPWQGSFRLSAGLYYNGNKLTGSAEPTITESITIGDKTYTASDNVKVDAEISWKKAAPYVGIGWSSAEKNGWHFTADIGVMYFGDPDVSITAQGNPDIQDELNIEAKKQEVETYNDIKDYKFYPVVMLGIQKKF